MLRNDTVAGPLTISAGTISTSSATNTGSFTSGGLAFGAGATSIRMKVGTGADLITGGAVTTAGTATFNLTQQGGALVVGNTYPLINYTGATPGLGGFALGALPGHLVGSLVDVSGAIALSVTANDKVVWDASIDGNWNINRSEERRVGRRV